MVVPKPEEIKDEFALAQEMLDDAEANLKQARLRTAISRAYYAMFHAARAVLWSRGITPKTHKGLVQQFGLRLVKAGVVEKEFARMLRDALDERELADYYAHARALQKKEAQQLLQETRRFLKKMEALLKSSSSPR
jgi:hypothetical protein